jgi:hypothetical protein
MSSRNAEVIAADSGDVTHAGTTDVGFARATHMGYAKTPHATSANATHVSSTKAAHVASAKAAHVAATATMPAAAAAAGLRTRGSKAAGKQRGCQNHHPSSFHDLSPLEWADVPPQDLRRMPAHLSEPSADLAIGWKVGVFVRRPY